MPPVIVLAGVSATAFVSTNVDAFLVLVANAARAPRSRLAGAAGFLAATALVLGVAWLLAGASRVIPSTHTGLLGLVPLGMGMVQIGRLVRRALRARRRESAPATPTSSGRPAAGSLRFGEALVLHLSLSTDNLAVYVALLSDTMPSLRPVVAATTLGLGLLWTALARAALLVPGLSPVLLRRGQAIMGVLLVSLGIYILLDTETDVLFPHAVRPPLSAVAGPS
jgi:cadmium resistance protein CadD (predicted permease)